MNVERVKRIPWGPNPEYRPRPFTKWLQSLGRSREWEDARADHHWLGIVRRLAEERECQFVYDPRHHWKESFFAPDYFGEGRRIMCGGAGNPNYACTSALHELGHLFLYSEGRHPERILRGEEEAWEVAKRLAREYRLPLMSNIRRQGLYSYRYWLLYREPPGSKRQNKRKLLPKSWQLEMSRRTRMASSSPGMFAMGKRGRRVGKRHIKKATAKAERRQAIGDS